jgi:hypothetical protein
VDDPQPLEEVRAAALAQPIPQARNLPLDSLSEGVVSWRRVMNETK